MQMQTDNIDYVDELFYNRYSITKNNYLKISNSSISFDDPIIKQLLEQCDNKLILARDTINLLDKIPHTITKLMLALDHYKNVSINNLPSSIKELYITSEYCDMDRKQDFDSSIDNLPPQLETLVIDSVKFNHSIDYLPITLKTLKIKSYSFNQSLDNLPSNLEHLELLKDYYSNYIPKKIVFTENLNNLPTALTKLMISIDYTINTDIEQFKSARPELHIDIIRNDNKITTYTPQNSLYDKLIDICEEYPKITSFGTGFGIGFVCMAIGYINAKIWSKLICNTL